MKNPTKKLINSTIALVAIGLVGLLWLPIKASAQVPPVGQTCYDCGHVQACDSNDDLLSSTPHCLTVDIVQCTEKRRDRYSCNDADRGFGDTMVLEQTGDYCTAQDPDCH
jgi:hypothetical protein